MDALLIRLCEIFRESESYVAVRGGVVQYEDGPRIEILMIDPRGNHHSFCYWE